MFMFRTLLDTFPCCELCCCYSLHQKGPALGVRYPNIRVSKSLYTVVAEPASPKSTQGVVEISLVISYSHGPRSQQDIESEAVLIKHCIALNTRVLIISDVETTILSFNREFFFVILWKGDGWFTSPAWFLDGSRWKLARTICPGQRPVSRKRNLKIPIGYHENLEMRT